MNSNDSIFSIHRFEKPIVKITRSDDNKSLICEDEDNNRLVLPTKSVIQLYEETKRQLSKTTGIDWDLFCHNLFVDNTERN